ncbi:hypothetical protein B9Z55_027663 [Caenorhabditis nigoni]|uniref:Uncharacterized protein n=1 Tax=Caenorhabditis nigoni TaxID=1611254 RepID=A0A2G5SES6_9PELO|nr:hypothetical protein B9Z55_027663 [Caenorhabditis nigoni]
MVFNADQTGIQKEIFGARALSFLGDKDVYLLVQSKSSLTHSFTFLPILYMDGSLGEKAFMVMAEPILQFSGILENVISLCGMLVPGSSDLFSFGV